MPAQTAKRSKKSKRPDGRPAKKRYWSNRILEKHKIANLVDHCGMSIQSAYKAWLEHPKTRRQGRVPDGFLRGVSVKG